MGEIIIKVPVDVKEIIEVNLPYNKIISTLSKLEKKEEINKALEILQRYRHKIEFKETSEEELHLQED